MISDGLTVQEEQAVIAGLQKLGKRWSPALFHAITPIVELPVVDCAFVRYISETDAYVFLTKRPDNDPHFAGQWHLPGSVHRATDPTTGWKGMSDYDALGRAFSEVGLDFASFVHHIMFVGICRDKHPRGSELHHVYYLHVEPELVDSFTTGEWHPASSLPAPMMEHHVPIIMETVDIFIQHLAGASYP